MMTLAGLRRVVARFSLPRDPVDVLRNVRAVEQQRVVASLAFDDVVVVAFCGSVMEKYHTFRERCQKILDELVQQPCPAAAAAAKVNGMQQGPFGVTGLQLVGQRRVVLEENGDGGILGAGILAAVVDTRELSSSVAEIAAAK